MWFRCGFGSWTVSWFVAIQGYKHTGSVCNKLTGKRFSPNHTTVLHKLMRVMHHSALLPVFVAILCDSLCILLQFRTKYIKENIAPSLIVRSRQVPLSSKFSSCFLPHRILILSWIDLDGSIKLALLTAKRFQR